MTWLESHILFLLQLAVKRTTASKPLSSSLDKFNILFISFCSCGLALKFCREARRSSVSTVCGSRKGAESIRECCSFVLPAFRWMLKSGWLRAWLQKQPDFTQIPASVALVCVLEDVFLYVVGKTTRMGGGCGEHEMNTVHLKLI